jgi:nitroreductase
MTFNDFKSLCEQRHSVRTFEKKPVAKEDIVNILELARMAPSVENLQPWRFHVISEQILRARVMACCCYGNFIESAGTLIVVRSKETPPKLFGILLNLNIPASQQWKT